VIFHLQLVDFSISHRQILGFLDFLLPDPRNP
jgi:hypothetical protein